MFVWSLITWFEDVYAREALKGDILKLTIVLLGHLVLGRH